VLPTIELDRKAKFVAIEIEHVGTACVLAAEFPAMHAAVAQQRPHEMLGVGGRLAQGADEGEGFFVERELFSSFEGDGDADTLFPHPPSGHLLPEGEG
jgi:hypothetical protein